MNVRGHHLYLRYLAGKDDRDDEKRREFILNALLCGISATGLVALAALSTLQLHFDIIGYLVIFAVIGGTTAACLSLWVLSRRGHHNLASYVFLAGMTLFFLKLALIWGFELPSFSLGLAMLITIAGVILQRRSALWAAILLASSLLVIGYIQSYGLLEPSAPWNQNRLAFIDSMGYATLLGLIGFVSWLANREIDYSLSRARESKRHLAEERDLLESRVVARTEELERAQLVRILELQRFADFGRLSAHLLHEIANPLTAATLHLTLADRQQSRAIQQAKKNLNQLERYVNATRDQLRAQSKPRLFSVRNEARQTMAVLSPLARRANVKLTVAAVPQDLKLFGDPVKFTQIVANIIMNAIDAYDNPLLTRREVNVSGYRKSGKLYITVHDWGKGIGQAELTRIFEPFYTTKTESPRGLGIGLALVKQTIEQDYGGSIAVSSSPKVGTFFTLMFRLTNKMDRNFFSNNTNSLGQADDHELAPLPAK